MEIRATRQNMSKVEDETAGLHSKQQKHEDMMMSISEDIGQLEGGTGYIPEHIQEHTTISHQHCLCCSHNPFHCTLCYSEEIQHNERAD